MKVLYKSLGLVAVLALGAFLPACNKVKDAISINLPTQTVTADFLIQPQQAGVKATTSFEYGINLDSLIKHENTSLGIGNIKSAKIKSVTLTLTNAGGPDNLGSFSDCNVSLSSSAKPDFTTIAGIANNPDNDQTTLEIPVNDVELKDYFNSTSFKYQLSATVRSTTSTVLTGKATIKFNVTAGL